MIPQEFTTRQIKGHGKIFFQSRNLTIIWFEFIEIAQKTPYKTQLPSLNPFQKVEKSFSYMPG